MTYINLVNVNSTLMMKTGILYILKRGLLTKSIVYKFFKIAMLSEKSCEIIMFQYEKKSC